MIRFNMSASNNPLFIGFYRNFYNPKKGSLSDFLSQYSKSKPGNFTVVQIGANDGITHDPIHKFIKRDDWKGGARKIITLFFHLDFSRVTRWQLLIPSF